MNAKSKNVLLTGLGGVLWFLAVMLAYSYTHKPFSAEQVFALTKVFWQVAVPIVIVSLGGGIGSKIISQREGLSPLALLVVQAALGLGFLGLVVLAMGYTLGFSTLYFVILLLVLGGFFRGFIWRWWNLWSALGDVWRESEKFDKFLAAGIGFILFSTLATALAPPLKFDALVYHLTLPQIYLFDGRINYVPDLIFWGMPQQVEMLNTFVMALAGLEAATVLGWAFGVLTLVGLLGYLADRFSPRAAWVALASLLAGGTLSASLSWAYVGWPIMLFGFCFFVFLDLWVSHRAEKFLWIAAVFAGFAVGTKYTAGILPVAALLVIFLVSYKKIDKHVFRYIFIFSGITLLVVSPWLVRNFLATGNPVYPLLFPSGAMDEHRLFLYQNGDAWGNWFDLIFLPWQATIWGLEGKAGYSAEIGALLLTLSPFALLGWGERSKIEKESLSIAFLITLTSFVIWAFAGRTSTLLIQSRLYLAFFPAWAILAGVGFERFSKLQAANVRFGRIASALVLLAFGFNIFVTGVNFTWSRAMETLIGVQSPASYQERALGTYERAMASVAELSDDAQVLMLWETRGLACIPDCEPDETIDRWYADIRNYGSSESVLDAWRAEGYTHLLFYERGADFVRDDNFAYTDADWDVLGELLGQLELEKDFSSIYKLYSLRSTK